MPDDFRIHHRACKKQCCCSSGADLKSGRPAAPAMTIHTMIPRPNEHSDFFMRTALPLRGWRSPQLPEVHDFCSAASWSIVWARSRAKVDRLWARPLATACRSQFHRRLLIGSSSARFTKAAVNPEHWEKVVVRRLAGYMRSKLGRSVAIPSGAGAADGPHSFVSAREKKLWSAALRRRPRPAGPQSLITAINRGPFKCIDANRKAQSPTSRRRGLPHTDLGLSTGQRRSFSGALIWPAPSTS